MLAVLFSKNHVLEHQGLFAVQLVRSSPLNETSFSSILVSQHISDNIFVVRSLASVTKPPFLQLILCCISNLFPQGHAIGNFEIYHLYLKLTESQNCCFDNSQLYSAMGDMVRQLDTPFLVLNCKSRLDFSDMLSLKCSIIFLNIFSFSFLISNLISLIAN